MLVLGPNVIRDGLTLDHALVACRGMALLGPNDPQTTPLDPIHRIFVIIGKIMSVRRVVMPESNQGPQECAIRTLEGVQMATLDESTDGDPSGYSAWDVVWQPLTDQVADRINDISKVGDVADQCVRRLMDLESTRILGLDPNLTLAQKVQAVMDYMGEQALSLEQQRFGMRDYLMKLFRDADGIPVGFPSSPFPTFPDSWITPDVITPANIGRAWLIIL